MPSGFGYIDHETQRPSPNPEQVGLGLVQQQQGPAQAGAAAGAGTGAIAGQTGTPLDTEAMRLQGAMATGGPGQVDETPVDVPGVHSGNALAASVGEALTRMADGFRGTPNPHKSDRGRAMQTLMQNGLSEVEAQLLIDTGGV